MSEQPIHYAQAPGDHATYSVRGMIGFACAVASTCGIVITMVLIHRPIPGPLGGFMHTLGPILGAAVLLLWLVGLFLGISAIRQRSRLPAFGRAALAGCGMTVVLFVLMIVLMY